MEQLRSHSSRLLVAAFTFLSFQARRDGGNLVVAGVNARFVSQLEGVAVRGKQSWCISLQTGLFESTGRGLYRGLLAVAAYLQRAKR